MRLMLMPFRVVIWTDKIQNTGISMSKLLCEDETFKIIGACFNVYNEIGSGFLESVYQECLSIELEKQGVPFHSQHDITMKYQGITLNQTFKVDFFCFDSIIVEIKAVKNLIEEHRAQLINYLRVSGMKVGLLINFCSLKKLEYERFVI